MNWKEEAALRLKRKNSILFSASSEFLHDLSVLAEKQNRRVLALWAFDLAEKSVMRLEEKYHGEHRPRQALQAARDWASGNIKMRAAQRKILDCHALAKEIDDREDVAVCHAIGQACSVVHTAGHAMGYPVYDLTATVYRYGIDNCTAAVERRMEEYIAKLFYFSSRLCDYRGTWADFMLK